MMQPPQIATQTLSSSSLIASYELILPLPFLHQEKEKDEAFFWSVWSVTEEDSLAAKLARFVLREGLRPVGVPV